MANFYVLHRSGVKKGADFHRKPVPLQLQSDPQLSDTPQNPLKYMALTNIVSLPALNKSGKPWRGNREISDVMFQILIEMCSRPNQIVVDISASTGGSARACKASGRHFFGLEADREIYEALLKPLCTASEDTDESNDDDLRSYKQW